MAVTNESNTIFSAVSAMNEAINALDVAAEFLDNNIENSPLRNLVMEALRDARCKLFDTKKPLNELRGN